MKREACKPDVALELRRALWIVIATMLALTICGPARAATITVDSLADIGSPDICVLRDAITAANRLTATNGCTAGTGRDTIVFAVAGTITLSSTLPAVSARILTITGPASPGITIDGDGQVEVLKVAARAGLNITDLTIANGAQQGLAGGINNYGNLKITNSAFFGNSTSNGGSAIGNRGTLFVSHSIFSNNGCGFFGGTIANRGVLTVTNSVFSGNACGYLGSAGIYNDGGTAAVNNSTFSDNEGDWGAGAIGNVSGNVIVTNSTFSGNRVFSAGGAIANNDMLTVTNSTFSGNSTPRSVGGAIYSTGRMAVTNSTFFGNSALDGSAIYGGTGAITNSTFFGNICHLLGGFGTADCSTIRTGASLKGTILADSHLMHHAQHFPFKSPNCIGTISDLGYNISDDSSCGFGASTSLNNTDPRLDPSGPQQNGGPTETVALRAGSPAIDTIPIPDCTDQGGNPLTTDQRGFSRPDAGEAFCDIGAYEFQQ